MTATFSSCAVQGSCQRCCVQVLCAGRCCVQKVFKVLCAGRVRARYVSKGYVSKGGRERSGVRGKAGVHLGGSSVFQDLIPSFQTSHVPFLSDYLAGMGPERLMSHQDACPQGNRKCFCLPLAGYSLSQHLHCRL